MRRRIEGHRAERGEGWSTIEEPTDLAGALARLAPETEVTVVDCLTVWLGNLVHRAGLADGSASAAAIGSTADARSGGSPAIGEGPSAPASRPVAAGAADLGDPATFPEIAALLAVLADPPAGWSSSPTSWAGGSCPRTRSPAPSATSPGGSTRRRRGAPTGWC
jgi:hypothetical protein